MNNKSQPKRHMGNQQKKNWLPKGQIGKTVSVEHYTALKAVELISKTPQPLLIFI